MSASTQCPECGAQRDGPPGQPCPACLIRLGLASWQSRREGIATTPLPGPAGCTALPAAAVEACIPAYEVLELLGQGGMGAVYRARQKSLGREVALKVLRPPASGEGSFPERFEREARALARLAHPNIVQVYDYGTSGGLTYLAMEYVDGLNLRRLMAEGDMTAEEVLRLVPDLCAALQYAHGEGVVHRDIKPENILVSRQGVVKIADFGLAKLTGAAADTLTGTHQVMGTPRYMAPEQLEATHGVDHRADIYSLGVVLYEILTGELPLGRFDPPSRRAAVDPGLDEIVLRTLAKDPERRYQQADELRSDLEWLSRGGPQVNRFRRRDEPVGEGRISWKAILGAGWAAFFPLAVAVLAMSFTGVQAAPAGPGPAPMFAARSLSLLGLVLFALGFTAPIGTTVLGVIATSDIRHSRGRLHGLGLAVIDSLVFPLLLLDFLVASMLVFLLRSTAAVRGISWAVGLPVLLGLLVALLMADVLIVWRVWRWARGPLAAFRPAWGERPSVASSAGTERE